MNNAKRRGKVFTLTLEEFEKFCQETDYIAKKGVKKKSLTIDRERNEEGYTVDNIRALPNDENARKGARVMYFDPVCKKTVVMFKHKPTADDPF
jgi:hypothetical protein